MKIAFVGAQDKPHELACTHWSGIRAAAKRMPHEIEVFCCRSGPEYVDRIIEWRPDVLIYNLIDMVHDKVDDSKKLRDKLPDTKTVFWYTDCRTPDTDQITTNISKYVDLFVTSGEDVEGFIEEHFGMKPLWVPQAAEPTSLPVHNDKVRETYGDFIFIGGKYPRGGFRPRSDLISEMERTMDLKVIDGQTPEERAKIYTAMPLLYGSAKFTLDISHFWHVPKYTSNRYWVVPAVFGFCMTKRFVDHEQLVPETHHVYWDTLEELADKMKYYGENEDERMEMVVKGWKYARDHHTYEHRINRILDLLGVV